MKILVTVKRIPDPAQKIKLKDGVLDLSAANWQLNQFDEYAVEAALRLTEDAAAPATRQGTVTVASLGPSDVQQQLCGAQEAVPAALTICHCGFLGRRSVWDCRDDPPNARRIRGGHGRAFAPHSQRPGCNV